MCDDSRMSGSTTGQRGRKKQRRSGKAPRRAVPKMPAAPVLSAFEKRRQGTAQICADVVDALETAQTHVGKVAQAIHQLGSDTVDGSTGNGRTWEQVAAQFRTAVVFLFFLHRYTQAAQEHCAQMSTVFHMYVNQTLELVRSLAPPVAEFRRFAFKTGHSLPSYVVEDGAMTDDAQYESGDDRFSTAATAASSGTAGYPRGTPTRLFPPWMTTNGDDPTVPSGIATATHQQRHGPRILSREPIRRNAFAALAANMRRVKTRRCQLILLARQLEKPELTARKRHNLERTHARLLLSGPRFDSMARRTRVINAVDADQRERASAARGYTQQLRDERAVEGDKPPAARVLPDHFKRHLSSVFPEQNKTNFRALTPCAMAVIQTLDSCCETLASNAAHTLYIMYKMDYYLRLVEMVALDTAKTEHATRTVLDQIHRGVCECLLEIDLHGAQLTRAIAQLPGLFEMEEQCQRWYDLAETTMKHAFCQTRVGHGQGQVPNASAANRPYLGPMHMYSIVRGSDAVANILDPTMPISTKKDEFV